MNMGRHMLNFNNEELNSLYEQAESVDEELYSEQRSNLLLVSGDHYMKKNHDAFHSRIREAKGVPDEVKLRLTKNHVQRISRIYINNILTNSPNVTILPQLDSEIQDQKCAEMNLAVWRYGYTKYKLKSKIRDFAQDFIDVGECICLLKWDPNKGDFKGFAQLQDEEGNDLVDEMGQPAPDEERPIFSGAFQFERVFGFNLMRAPEAKDMDESPYFIIRKMVDTKELKKIYAADEEKVKHISSDEDETYLIFNGNRSAYNRSSKETLLLEYYFRPCMKYPRGYFIIKTKTGILEQGELPFGIFPIVYKGFEKLQTSPRCHSKIKQLRPYQIEINRSASAIGTHQITIGDDKLVTNTAGKIESGGTLPGLRVVKVPGGGTLTVIPGRSGEQYMNYMQSQIAEMYVIANIAEEMMDKELNGDAFNLLFASIKEKKKFSMYIEKFEEFLCELAELFLDMSRYYLPEDELIPAVGKREAVNLSEFRNSNKLYFSIKSEPQTSDPTTLFGKQLVLNHTLQYCGAQLAKDDIGKMIRNMPFANMEDDFSDLTIDFDNAKNDILALERGEQVQANLDDKHEYVIQKLTHRMKQRDYQFLAPQIQQNFQMLRAQHQQILAQQQQEIQAAQAGFIPTGGYLVKADFYIPNKATGKNERATLPYEAVDWLVKKLEQQGLAQQNLSLMQESALAGIAQNMIQNQGQEGPQVGAM